MLRTYKILLHIVIVLSFIFIGEGEAGSVKVTDVRFWTAPDHIRIVFDLSSRGEYKILEPSKPKIIEFEITSAKSVLSNNRIQIEDDLVKTVNLMDSKDGLKVRLELKEKAPFKIFFLKEYLHKPNRIIIDIMRPGGKGAIGFSQEELDDLKKKTKIVVIDPGHGGEDPGAIGRTWRLKEKDVVLDISKRLAKILNDTPGVRAFLTRTGDYFIPLRKRTEIARKYKADLFVSIHTNANRNRRERGSSVYVVSLKGATDEASQLLADRENAADMIGGVSEVEDDTLAMILLDLTQTSTLNESLALGEMCMNSIARLGKTENDGVKRAGFVVLKAVDIPSILIETAFISNRREEALLRTSKFRRDLARAISKGILEYLELEEPMPVLAKLARDKQSPIFTAKYHIVKKGETLWRIAKNYGVSIGALRETNELNGSNLICVGQKLIIPR